jgi:diguanylate cyclase (GGDEF)-like protein/PAS domain S-box-containing protein
MTHDEEDSIYKTLVENSMDTLVLATPELERLYVSPSGADVLGHPVETLLGKTPADIIHPDDRSCVLATIRTLGPEKPTANIVWRAIRADGSHRWLETTYRWLPDGRIVAVIRDIQRRKEVEAQLEAALRRLESLAMVDPLTEIPNRRCFLEAVERQLAGGDATASQVSLLLVDLDDFKPINDLRGHGAGDAVLVAIARRLQELQGELARVAGDTTWLVARLGGDEFAVLLTSADPAQSDRAATAIVRAVMAPISIEGGSVSLTASVGVTHALPGVDDTKAMLLRADLAMYQAKRQGGAGYCTFGEEHARPVVETEWGWMRKAPGNRTQGSGRATRRRRGKGVSPGFEPLLPSGPSGRF